MSQYVGPVELRNILYKLDMYLGLIISNWQHPRSIY